MHIESASFRTYADQTLEPSLAIEPVRFRFCGSGPLEASPSRPFGAQDEMPTHNKYTDILRLQEVQQKVHTVFPNNMQKSSIMVHPAMH